MEQHYPKTMIAKGVKSFRSPDYAATIPPALSSTSLKPTSPTCAKVIINRDGSSRAGSITFRCVPMTPSQVAEFYAKIFELKEAETYRDQRLDLHDRR